MDENTIKNTFKEYNKAASSKKDKFGKTLFPATPFEDNEIFYAGIVSPALHYTMGGLRFDTDGKILRKDGSHIIGLYGVGEVTGGLHGENRLAGNSLLECVVYGLRVSKYLSESLKKENKTY